MEQRQDAPSAGWLRMMRELFAGRRRRRLLLFLLLSTSSTLVKVSSAFAVDKSNPAKVLVTGAAGKTGRLVFEALLNDPAFEPIALVRSEKSAKQLRHDIPQTGLAQIIVCDITSLSSGSVNGAAAAAPAPILDDFAFGLLGGCKAMIICTSAVPVLVKRSLFQALVLVPWNVMRGKKNATILDTLRFRWKDGQTPEQVDYYGQKAQIDVFARQLGMERVVLLSSMGVCDPHHALNKIGKNPVDGSGHGDILLWKRKAEQYLMAQSSQSQADRRLDYVIVHPGGLTDGPGGQDEIVLDVNDRLIERQKQQQQQQGGDDSVGRVVVKRSIHRADVAALCVAALTEGKNYAFDCVAAAGAPSSSSFDHKKEGIVSSTYAATILSAREALRSFVKYQQAEQKTSRQQNKKPPTRALSYSSSP